MEGVIIGTTAGASQENALKVRSVLVTALAAGPASVILSDANPSNALAPVKVTTPLSSTTQVSFKGLSFPNGLTITVDGDIDSYIVEYDR